MTSASNQTTDFFVGSGRCGSSVVHEVICRHQSVGFLDNFDDRIGRSVIPRKNVGRLYRDLPPSVTRKGRIRLAPSEGYRALQREVSPMLATSHRDLVAADATPFVAKSVTDFFDRRRDKMPEPNFVHKFTGWPRIGFLDAIYPEAKFVNIVRDGRAVVNSWLQTNWWRGYGGPEASQFGDLNEEERAAWEASGESYALLAGFEWRRLVTAAYTTGEVLGPDRYMEARFEDFLLEPEAVIERIMKFLELDEDPGFAQRLERLPVHKSRADAYEKDLGAATVELLTEALSPLLGRYGYLS